MTVAFDRAAFGHAQLRADEREPLCAERTPYGYFLLPRRTACHKQIGHIQTADQ